MIKITEELAKYLIQFLSTNYGLLNSKEYDLCIATYRMVLGKLGYENEMVDAVVSDLMNSIIQAGNYER